MDKLPSELVRLIVEFLVASSTKNEALEARLVCRTFDELIRPEVLRTLNLDFTRLSHAGGRSLTQIDGLQTIGHRCEALFIDLAVLRDEDELDFIDTTFARVPSMRDFCLDLRREYSLNPECFTENQYLQSVANVLSNCPKLRSMRINLPCQLVCPHSGAATRIIANTFKALAEHADLNADMPGGDSGLLETLVLDNLTDWALLDLWMNPLDIAAAKTSMQGLRHLVLVLRNEVQLERVERFGSALWEFIRPARGRTLQSLALLGLDRYDYPWRGHRVHTDDQLPAELWSIQHLLCPPLAVLGLNITCLELRHVQIGPADLERLLSAVGPVLEELFLHDIYLGVAQTTERNRDGNSDLWVGLPGEPPPADGHWIAFKAYQVLHRLRICRARGLYYDRHLGEGLESDPEPGLDRHDPCCRGRHLGQRFVEVVMGVPQPPVLGRNRLVYLVDDVVDLGEVARRRVPKKGLDRQYVKRAVDYDTLAYHAAVANTTSRWLESLDGRYRNYSPGSAKTLQWIAANASKGMNEIHRRRSEAAESTSVANEFIENVTMGLAVVEDGNGDYFDHDDSWYDGDEYGDDGGDRDYEQEDVENGDEAPSAYYVPEG